MRAHRVPAVGAAILLAACGATSTESEPSSATPALDADAIPDVVITRDVEVADLTTADIVAPAGADDLPVVVMFHGSDGLRSNMEPLAMEVARSGAVVVVPSWPVIVERPPSDTTEDVYFDQTAARCAPCGSLARPLPSTAATPPT